jgi:hypothetical protein
LSTVRENQPDERLSREFTWKNDKAIERASLSLSLSWIQQTKAGTMMETSTRASLPSP